MPAPTAPTTKRIALVTGGTGGIGTSICQVLQQSGYTVVSASSSQAKADTWKQQQAELGFDIETCVLDVADHEACRNVVLDLEEVHGPVSVLVNAAGVTRDGTMKKMSLDQWQTVIDINLTGTFNMCRSVVPFMLERGFGRILNISSINGQKGQFGQVNYAASKAGIHGLTMSLAQEVASKGITVNTISPGYIATDMVLAVPEEVRNKIIGQIPVGRLGTPDEIARIVDFLAADGSGFITGSNIAANGGQHMQF